MLVETEITPAFVTRGAVTVPMVPCEELRVNVGAVIVPVELEILPFTTEKLALVVALTVPPNAILPLLLADAVIVPPSTDPIVMLPAAESVTVVLDAV